MSKTYISIYAPKAVHISNLYHNLTNFSERVNNSLKFHLVKRDIFHSNLDSQHIIHKRVYFFKYPELSEKQLYIAICTFSAFILKKADHNINLVNFKIQNDRNGLFKLTAYIPITND